MSQNGDQPIMFSCIFFKEIHLMFKDVINLWTTERQQELGAYEKCCGVKIDPRLITVINQLVNYALHWHWATIWCQFISKYFEQHFTMISHSVPLMNHHCINSPPRTHNLSPGEISQAKVPEHFPLFYRKYIYFK